MFQVNLDMFSGRNNPTWSITGEQASSIIGTLIRNPEIIASRPGFSGLGYRGIQLTSLSEEGAEEGIPRSVWIANGGSEDEEHGLELAEQIIEQGFSEQQNIPSLKGDRLIDDQVRERVLTSLVEFTATVAQWREGIALAAEQDGGGDDDATAAGCTYDYNQYQPATWNSDSYTRWNNNCYAYACNKMTNTFAQPGRAHGIYPNAYCGEITTASQADGLVLSSNCQPASAGRRYMVALVTDPGWDYHWYRQADEGYWGHKPGHTDVINTDNSGYVIYNPKAANLGMYTSWCGYMCAPSNLVSIS